GIMTDKHNQDNPLEHAGEREDALYQWEKKESVDDARVPYNPGSQKKERSPMAFRGHEGVLYLRVDTRDDKPHRLSLYLLDYKRIGMAFDIDILDTQGNHLETRRVDNFKEGSYLRYRFTGSVIVRIAILPL